jgi:hypothetical protein
MALKEHFMRITKLISTVALAATLAISSLGVSAATTTYNFSGSGAGAFNDKYTFSGLTAGTYNILGSLDTSTFLGLSSLGFQGTPETLSLSLFGTTFGSNTFSLTNFVYTGSSPLKFNVAGLGFGSFSGFLSFSPVLAVPEAETYSMMLLGLGLMGFIVYRRRND